MTLLRPTEVILGTAQFAPGYGVANRGPSLSRLEADELLVDAWRLGIRTLDTARAYGDAEDWIGRSIQGRPHVNFKVITKIDGTNASDVASMRAWLERNYEILGRRLHALLVHNPEALVEWSDRLSPTLERFVEDGLVSLLGASIYSRSQFELALRCQGIRIIQLPFNVLNQTFAEDDIRRAQQMGREVHVRSVLLQGFLMVAPEQLSPAMAFASQPLRQWREICRDYDVDLDEAAIKFAVQQLPNSKLVIGFETRGQLRRTLRVLAGGPLSPDLVVALRRLVPVDERVADPRVWPAR